MKFVASRSILPGFLIFGICGGSVYSQNPPLPQPPPPAAPRAMPTPRFSQTLSQKVVTGTAQPVATEKRQLAYAKLLEGQRYTWIASRSQNRTRSSNAVRLARQALVAAIEADPSLAEAYTSLAELEILLSPTEAEIEEAIALARLAVKADTSNFGSRRLMGRLLSYKSKVGSGDFDQKIGESAVAEWNHVTKQDPRNAEAWAFLAALYKDLGKKEERLNSLRSWVSSATPVDTYFYRIVMGSQETLTIENAQMKLGAALLEAKQTREAIEILSRLVADDPENLNAVEMLRDTIEEAQENEAQIATEALQQAVYANPDNIQLIDLLSKVYAQAGKFEDAIKLFKTASERLGGSDPVTAASFQITLGDMLAEKGNTQEAVLAYRNAIEVLESTDGTAATSQGSEALLRSYEKLIKLYGSSANERGVLDTVSEARKKFGTTDLFADRQLIAYYRENGKRKEALDTVKAVRKRIPEDLGFVRLEATLLTENGRVEEAVSLVKATMSTKPKTAGTVNGNGSSVSVSLPMQDEFSNYLFISNLYTQAGEAKKAVEAANHAFQIAQGSERKQIAKLTLASAQNLAGQHDDAEATLREILKQTPGNPIALNNLGYFLIERNVRLDEAKTMIEQAVKVDPTNPSYLDSLGWAYFKLGKFAEAEKYLKEAAGFDPMSSTIQEHLGDVYSKQNRNELARSAWERSLKLTSDPADVKRLKDKLKMK